MSEWKVLTAEDFCDSVRDGTHDTPKQVECGYKLVTAKHISNGQIDLSDAYLISESDYLKINERSKVERWDVLMSMIGNGLGKSAVVKDNPQYAIKNLALFKIGDETRAKWLHYYLSSNKGQGFIYNSLQGSGQPFISLSLLRKFPIPVPDDEKIMRKVVATLSRYDSLIENYQKQIKLLEEAAQRLYKEWFVDLHFPGHEYTKIVDGVPEGWEKKRLSDIANIIMGQSPKSEFYNTEGDGIPFHQGVGSYGYRFVVDNVYSTSFTRIAEPNSILFSVRAPVGRLNITKNKIVIGRGLASINHKMGYQSYLYYLLKEKFFKDNIIGNGAIFASISKDELYNLVFFIPSDEIVKRYDAIANKIDKNIQYVDSQIRLLTEARDRLLPKLMSGEIAV